MLAALLIIMVLGPMTTCAAWSTSFRRAVLRGGHEAPSPPSPLASLDDITPITLVSPSGTSTAVVSPFGACVLSYVNSGQEFLATRSDSVPDGAKPLHQGLPFCWPQFGPGPLQQHGLARYVVWEVADVSASQVTFVLVPNDYTRARWNKEFELRYKVTLGDTELAVELTARNTGAAPFLHQAALHTYFRVSDIREARISGAFAGSTFIDKTDRNARKVERRNVLDIVKFTDAVYLGVHKKSQPVSLQSGEGFRRIEIVPETGFEDCVVWNPGGTQPGMEHVENWRDYVCIESAMIEPQELAPGEEWVGRFALRPQPVERSRESP